MHGEVKRAGADDDLVWLHMHFKATPDSPGSSVMHAFRMEDGKFAEHWGVGTQVRESELHDNSMF
jgi:predicted SnoaL-like aldol condensation-catalyzing enzyme